MISAGHAAPIPKPEASHKTPERVAQTQATNSDKKRSHDRCAPGDAIHWLLGGTRDSKPVQGESIDAGYGDIVATGGRGTPASSLQLKCTLCEEEERDHLRSIARPSTAVVQRKQASTEAAHESSPTGSESAVDFGYSDLIAATRATAPRRPDSTGMPAPVRAKIEAALGADFSDVRVHPDSARAVELGALAFTQGSDIHVAPGQWAPETTQGQELLGHELAHVLQQRTGRVKATAQLKGVGLNEEPALESEADALGARAAQGDTAGASVRTPAASQVGDAVQRALVAQRGQRESVYEPGHIVQQSRAAGSEPVIQRLSYAELKETVYSGMISGVRAFKSGILSSLRKTAASLSPEYQGAADTLIEVVDWFLGALIGLISGVIGIVVGFGEGIVGLIEGLITLNYGAGKLLFDLITGIFTNFKSFKEDISTLLAALKSLPGALKQLIDDWLVRFGKASSERQSLMIGELTGQVLALIATYAVIAGRAGTASKAVATAADAATTGGTAAVEATAVGMRVVPVRAVMKGGGGGGASAAARTGGTVGNLALKAPLIEELPQVAPLTVVAPVPAAAPAAHAAAAAASSQGVGLGTKIAIGVGIAAAAVTEVATTSASSAPPEPEPVMPPGLSRPKKELWKACNELHTKYKGTQGQFAAVMARMNPLQIALSNNRASVQDRNDFCAMINEAMELAERLKTERKRYIDMDCDQFDWFDRGTTPAKRREKHEGEWGNVKASIGNLHELLHKFCS